MGLRENRERLVSLARRNIQGPRSVGQHDQTSDEVAVSVLQRERPRLSEIQVGVTAGEARNIYRRRLGWSQEQSARFLKYGSRQAVSKAEADETLLSPQEAACLQLSTCEKMYLLRRRWGKSQKELAPLIGVSRYWLSQMEIGAADCTKLEEFWS